METDSEAKIELPPFRAPDSDFTKPKPKDKDKLPNFKEKFGDSLTPRPLPLQPKVPGFYIPGVTQACLDGLPIRTYAISGVYYNMTQPQNETRSSHKRWTIDRREITYTLEVVQQPEKARACGSGPRSSADRRPVDPPPVVELKVFSNGVDVTMSYDATFMLYASLEVARPIAGGKMHTPQTIPVLTGVAVASAAYLTRPEPAAYFIFPDLAVRHEGWYRLKFSLFEAVKNEVDADMDKPFIYPGRSGKANDPPVRHESMANRLEVKSIPFQVYSAKKFPGLATSTTLSKLVAEQGCRVRIRRDIRQRKRSRKQQMADPEADDALSSYQGTPQASIRQLEHSRSASRNSLGSQYDPIDRRGSMESLQRHPMIQSRQPSVVSMSMPSPGPPSAGAPSSMAPPPPTYHNSPGHFAPDLSPVASPYSSAPRPHSKSFSTPSARPELFSGTSEFGPRRMPPLPALPPLPPILDSFQSARPPQRAGLYETREHQPTKRHASSLAYDPNRALKDRARPDFQKPGFPASSPFGFGLGVDASNQVIEADTGDEDDSEEATLFAGPMSYPRADGSQANKNIRMPHDLLG